MTILDNIGHWCDVGYGKNYFLYAIIILAALLVYIIWKFV